MEESRDLNGPWLVLATVRFLAELGMLAAIGYAGWRLAGEHQGIGAALALVFAALAAAVWARWVAPRAKARLEDPARLVVEIVMFGIAVAGLVIAGAWIAALVLGAAYAVSAPVGRKGH